MDLFFLATSALSSNNGVFNLLSYCLTSLPLIDQHPTPLPPTAASLFFIPFMAETEDALRSDS
jgi:hypothetical protein